jgi:hypothetical protein
VSDKINIPVDIKLKIVEDYKNLIRNDEICSKYDLTAPRLYNILKEYDIPKKGPRKSEARSGEDIKCLKCGCQKHQSQFPKVKGVYRTLCKTCHCHNEKIRRSKMSPEEKKLIGERCYNIVKAKKLKASRGELPLSDQIYIWVNKITGRRTEERFKERKKLCKNILTKKCYSARQIFPDIIFCFVNNTGQNRAMIASLDRIDPSKGYTDENTQIIPYWLNSAKLDSSQEEIDNTIINYILNDQKLLDSLKSKI